MAKQKSLNIRKALVSISLMIVLTSCTGVIVLSGEEPYSSMIGECYVLQQDMKIYENVCWDIGELILSPDDSKSCFRDVIGDVDRGSKIAIADVRRKRFGSFGYCPQVIVKIKKVKLLEGNIYIPLCLSRDYISWLEDPVWRPGDEIHLKSDYTVPCE